MSDGEIKLYVASSSNDGRVVDVVAGAGHHVLAVSLDPGGFGLVNTSTGGWGSVWRVDPADTDKRPLQGAAVLAAGSYWYAVYQKHTPLPPPQFGSQLVESGVVSVALKSGGGLKIAQVGPSYSADDVEAVSLACAADGSVWVALASTGSVSQLERIWAPPPGRTGPHPAPAFLPSSVDLPGRFRPLLITGPGDIGSALPGSLYVVASVGATEREVIGAVTLDPQVPGSAAAASGRFKVLAHLPRGTSVRMIRAADGAAWILGAASGPSAWLFTYANGEKQWWTSSSHKFVALTEGPQHTNIQGHAYRAMFLARTAVGADHSDIVTFRNDPVGGIGWTTKPPTHLGPSGQPVEPDAAIQGMTAAPDDQGRYWFAYVSQPASSSDLAYGLGYFDPPTGDPLDQP